MYFNIDKCKVMHIGKHNPETKYTMKKGDSLSDIITCDLHSLKGRRLRGDLIET